MTCSKCDQPPHGKKQFCEKHYKADYYLRNRDALKIQKANYYSRNREKIISRVTEYQSRNVDKIRAYHVAYRRTPQGYAIYKKSWSSYYKRLIQATPRSLSAADRNAIESFFENCPPGYHVDHIVPLKHELVSGLNVLANLQYLAAKENRRKRNKFDINQPQTAVVKYKSAA